MLKGLHDVPIIFGRGKKISVVFVSQGIGHTSHHLLIGSLHLRSEFTRTTLYKKAGYYLYSSSMPRVIPAAVRNSSRTM